MLVKKRDIHLKNPRNNKENEVLRVIIGSGEQFNIIITSNYQKVNDC